MSVLVASSVAIAFHRKWVRPWRDVEQLVDDVGNARVPPTFLVDGNPSAHRIGLALEDIFILQRALADHARLDKFQLCRAFRDEVGLPPHAYVTHRRVARAQELLARGVAQAEIAACVGLYDQSLLHRHFKRIVGITPGAFARSLR